MARRHATEARPALAAEFTTPRYPAALPGSWKIHHYVSFRRAYRVSHEPHINTALINLQQHSTLQTLSLQKSYQKKETQNYSKEFTTHSFFCRSVTKRIALLKFLAEAPNWILFTASHRPFTMLRRPPTVLTLTSEDVKAYEDHREAEAFQHATAAAQLRRQQQLARNLSGMDITGITTSSDEEDYSEQEASYYPNRTYSQNARISREENIDSPPEGDIYRNEGDSDDYEDASEGGSHAGEEEEAFVEDQDMAEAEQMDLDADHTDNDDDNDQIRGGAVPNLHHTRRQQQQEPIFPSPPPAPSRMTRSTRSASTEPSSSQAQAQQQQPPPQQQPVPAGRFPRGAGAAQTHPRAPSGRTAGATEATTPTPVAQAQRDAADRVRARATRSRDERIGVARGGRR